MTKIEFCESLRRQISVVNDYTFVNDTMEYYQNYIEVEIRQGKSEEEVMAELGDPRLIAKSIIASRGMDNSSTDYDEATDVNNDRIQFATGRGRQFNLPVWLVKAGAIVVAVALVILVGAIAIKLLPVICVAVLAVMLYRFFKENFR